MLRSSVYDRGLGLAALSVGCFVCASTVAMVACSWVPAPYADQWEQLVTGRADVLSWLPSQHNEHRILVPRLVFMLDRWWGAERNVVDLIVGIGLQLILVGLLMRLGRAAWGARPAWTALLAGTALAAAFWSVQWENFTWGFQVQFFGVVVGAALLFCLVASSRIGLAPILFVMVAETYTLSIGVLACLTALPLAAYVARPRRQIAVLAAAFVVLATLYAVGYRTPGQHSDPTKVLQHLGATFAFATAELGNPFGQVFHTAFGLDAVLMATLFGIGAIILVVLYTIALVVRRRSPRAGALGALLLFLTGMAFVTAAGRVRFGVEEALVSRYATPMLALWVCLAIAIRDAVKQRSVQDRAVAAVVPVLLVSLACISQTTFSGAALEAADLRAGAVPALLAGVDDATAISPLYPRPEDLFALLPMLRAARTSLFADRWATWFGTPLDSVAGPAPAGSCSGTLAALSKITSEDHGGWHAEGRLDGDASRVVLTGADGVVMGYGVAQRRSGAPHWIGAFRGEAVGVTAYALVDGKACPLQTNARIVPTPVIDFAPAPPAIARGGSIEAATFDPHGVITGWAPADGKTKPMVLHIDTNLPIDILSAEANFRPDVARALQSDALETAGFTIRVAQRPGTPRPDKPHLCIWSEDPTFGRAEMIDLSGADLCP